MNVLLIRLFPDNKFFTEEDLKDGFEHLTEISPYTFTKDFKIETELEIKKNDFVILYRIKKNNSKLVGFGQIIESQNNGIYTMNFDYVSTDWDDPISISNIGKEFDFNFDSGNQFEYLNNANLKRKVILAIMKYLVGYSIWDSAEYLENKLNENDPDRLYFKDIREREDFEYKKRSLRFDLEDLSKEIYNTSFEKHYDLIQEIFNTITTYKCKLNKDS